MKLYALLIMLMSHFVIVVASDEIIDMRFDWRGGYSPYKYITIEINNIGSGRCDYATFNDTVNSTFLYDEESLESLKEKFNILHNANLDSTSERICSDCGVTTLSYTLGKRTFVIEKILPEEKEFRDVTDEFYKIFSGEEYLYGLKEFLASSDRTLSNYWRYVGDLANGEFYNPSRFKPFLEEIASDTSIRPEIRILASDRLPPEWNWNQYGVKMELIISKTRFRIGEPIELTIKITNMKSEVDSLGSALWTLGFDMNCEHGRNERCSYNSGKRRLMHELTEKYVRYTMEPGETITLNIAFLQDLFNFQKGKHAVSLGFIYDTIFDGDHAVYRHIRSNKVEFEIY